MIDKQKRLEYYFEILVWVFIFLLLLKNMLTVLDPDLGWHLKVGQDLVVNHIFPRYDFYTFSHAGFGWVDHEWLSDALLYVLYVKIGFIFTAIVFALIISYTLFLQRQIICKFYQVKNILLIYILFILAIAVILNLAAIRMQVFSWLGLTLVLYILTDHYFNLQNKKIYYLPLLFLLWANIHGSFPIGLALLLIYSLLCYKNNKKIIVIFLISLAITLINPYGFSLWQEIIKTFFDSYAKSRILEWLPLWEFPISLFDFLYLGIFLVTLIYGFKSKVLQKIPKFLIIFSIIAMFAALSSKRNMAVFIFTSLPLLTVIINNLLTLKIKKILYYWQVSKFHIFLLCFVVFLTILAILSQKDITKDLFNRQDYFLFNASEYLKNQSEQKNTFNNFAMGGYILWKIPEIKVFYDGRMAHWKDKNGNKFFKEYNQIYSGVNWQELFKKYQINQVIVPRKTYGKLIFKKDLLNKFYYNNKLEKLSQESKLSVLLENNKEWVKVYQDEYIIIVQKIE